MPADIRRNADAGVLEEILRCAMTAVLKRSRSSHQRFSYRMSSPGDWPEVREVLWSATLHRRLSRWHLPGNRALTRYEFAAGLNACLDRVNELIAAATSDLVRKEDPVTYSGYKRNFQLNSLCARAGGCLGSRYSAIEETSSPLPPS